MLTKKQATAYVFQVRKQQQLVARSLNAKQKELPRTPRLTRGPPRHPRIRIALIQVGKSLLAKRTSADARICRGKQASKKNARQERNGLKRLRHDAQAAHHPRVPRADFSHPSSTRKANLRPRDALARPSGSGERWRLQRAIEV